MQVEVHRQVGIPHAPQRRARRDVISAGPLLPLPPRPHSQAVTSTKEMVTEAAIVPAQ